MSTLDEVPAESFIEIVVPVPTRALVKLVALLGEVLMVTTEPLDVAETPRLLPMTELMLLARFDAMVEALAPIEAE